MKDITERNRHFLYTLLRKSERYFRTDMVYLTKSGFWMNLNYIMVSVFSFGTSIAFAYFVSKELYGTYKYIISAVGIFTAFSLTGMNMAVVRAVAQGYEGLFKKSLSIQLFWSVPQCIILCAIGVYYFSQGNALFGLSFVFASILAPISSTANTYNAYLTGKKDFRAMAVYGIYSALFNFVLLGAAILFSQELLVLILTFFIARAVFNIIFCWKTIATHQPNDRFRSEDVSYAKHMSVMNILGEIAVNIENVIVFQMLGPVSVSIYTFALAMPDRLKSLFGFIGTAALAKMSEKTDLKVGENIRHKIFILVVLGLILAICYVPLAPYIFSLFFPRYLDSVLFSQIYAVSMITIAASIPVGALYAKKMQKQLYILNITSPVLKIGIFVLGTYCWGLPGAIISKVIYALIQVWIPTQLLFSDVQKNEIS